jgi:methylated-DNA-[protein]-cysteine S-methyltransferase
METKNEHKIISSAVGALVLVADGQCLRAVLWHRDYLSFPIGSENVTHPILEKTETQLREYFSGKRSEFDLPITFSGTTFQNKVWRALLTIPYGRTESYEGLARQIGSPKACRAVGAANGKNPLSIVVPCHRVIGKNGKLVGFGGGMGAKSTLIEIERLAI